MADVGAGPRCRELSIVDPTPGGIGDTVLDRSFLATFVDGSISGFLVVEAPPAGLIRAELLRGGSDEPVLSYIIREP